MPHRELLSESQRLSFQAPASDERDKRRMAAIGLIFLKLIDSGLAALTLTGQCSSLF